MDNSWWEKNITYFPEETVSNNDQKVLVQFVAEWKNEFKELFVGYYSNYQHICACVYFFVCKANKFKRLPTDSLLFSAGLSVFVWSPAGLWALSIQYRNKGQELHKILQYLHIPVCTVCQSVCVKDNYFPFPLSLSLLSLEHVLHTPQY